VGALDMSLRDTLRQRAAALLGVSAYTPPANTNLPGLDDPSVERIREAQGGNLQPLPTTKLRWYLADLEKAQAAADQGNLALAAQLYRAMRRDGVFAGLLGARTSGLVRLPKRFYGDPEIASVLKARNGTRSVFDEMFPPSELALLAADGIMLGVGVAELVPVPGRDYPVMVRLDPQYLQYRWSESRWYFLSIAGAIPITPGDGRWVLHIPGGRMAPWNSGLWPACSRSFINKEHAMLHRSNYSAKLANPARAAIAPIGANEDQRKGFLQRLIAWGVNTVFELPVGWDVKIIESNGRGWEIFQDEIKTSDEEYMISINGQLVTTTGGTGFSNQDVQKNVRQDLIEDTGDGLAYTINTQGIPPFVVQRWGIESLETRATQVDWDTSTPKDLNAQASSLSAAAGAIKSLDEALAPHAKKLDVDELTVRFDVPLLHDDVSADAAVANAALEGARDRATQGEVREAA
jgi:hypothetical protein